MHSLSRGLRPAELPTTAARVRGVVVVAFLGVLRPRDAQVVVGYAAELPRQAVPQSLVGVGCFVQLSVGTRAFRSTLLSWGYA